MRCTLAGLLLIAACYAPSIVAGVPCATNGLCPEGQTCTPAGVCRLPGSPSDAGGDSGDAINPDDRDGDGVADSADNCPDIANADQANEDGDRFGDRCDPCPPDRNDSPSDPDGDGVADACDPNPTVAGDAIDLFEGFHSGLPAWSPSPNWAAAATGEAIEVKASVNADEFILVPATRTDDISVTASMFVVQLTGNDIDHEIGLSVPYEVSTYSGIGCDLVDDAGRFVGMWDDFADRPFGTTSFTWANNTEYRITMVHQGTSYACTVVEPNGTKHPTSGTSSSTVGSPAVAVRAHAVTARISWVMIVRSP